jgi:ATP/maltotriose-dependent transcriptional regulator MalT
VHNQLRRLQNALRLTQTLAIRREAVALLGIAAGLAGNLSLDTGRDGRARSYFDVGQAASKEAEDPDLTAWLLANQGIERFHATDHAGALALLNEAHKLAISTSNARRRAWIVALRARVCAAMGEANASLRDRDQAYQVIDNANEPQGMDFFDLPRLDGLAGSTNVLLGRTGEGARLLTNAIDQRPATNLKGKALLTLDLADGRVTDGDLEEAGRLVAQAITFAGQSPIHPFIGRARLVQTRLRSRLEETGGKPSEAAPVRTRRRS